MAVKIGTVATFAGVKADKAQVVKILEECAEVYSAFENWCDCGGVFDNEEIINGVHVKQTYIIATECADVIQATCNLLAALGVDDLTAVLDRCKQKNIERGRKYGL